MKKLNILIIEGNQSIGSECVLKFLENGHNVYFTSKKKINRDFFLSKKFNRSIKNLHYIQFNPLDFDNYSKLKKKIKKIDCLINNAGDIIKKSSFEKSSINLWRNSFDINFFSTLYATKIFLGILKKNKNSNIINISSLSASFGGFPDAVHYGIAKSALDKLTQSLAKELGKYNIKVNSILPSENIENSKTIITNQVYFFHG